MSDLHLQDLRSAPRKRWPGPKHISFERLSSAFGRLLQMTHPPSATKLWRWEGGKGKTESQDQNLVPNLLKVYELLALEDRIDLGSTLDELAAHYGVPKPALSPLEIGAIQKNRDPGDLNAGNHYALGTPTALRFGLVAQPDAAILATIVAQEFGAENIICISREDFPRIPKMLMEGVIDIAIFGSAALQADPNFGILAASSPFVHQPLMRLRGNAVLVAAGEGWETFGQVLARTTLGGVGRVDRDIRLRNALAITVLQLVDPDRGVSIDDICLPGKSARRRGAFSELLKIARAAPLFQSPSRPPEATPEALDDLNKLIGLLDDPQPDDSRPLTGSDAFSRFLEKLKSAPGGVRSRAIFPAGLTHRLIAEDHEAAPLIDSDELQSIATLRSPHLERAEPGYLSGLLFPVNVAAWTKTTARSCQSALAHLRDRWNEHVVALRDRHTPTLGRLATEVDDYMHQALQTQHQCTKEQCEIVWPTNQGVGEDQLRRLIDEQLIEFFYWP